MLRGSVNEVGKLLDKLSTRGLAAIRAANKELVSAFVRTWQWSLVIPGTHKGGISNDELFEVLGSQERDFGTDSVQLDVAVRNELQRLVREVMRPVSTADLQRMAGPLVRDFVVSRMLGGGRDIPLRPLTEDYARRKRRKYPGRPIGIASGELLRAVRQARVVFR